METEHAGGRSFHIHRSMVSPWRAVAEIPTLKKSRVCENVP